MQLRSNPWVRGGLAGAIATAPMSVVMLAAKALGQTGTLPPTRIATSALHAAGLRPSRPARAAATLVGHFGFGASCGALYAWLHRERAGRARGALHGAAFGSLVWAVSYAGWVPALGLLPRPEDDRRHRPSAMILSHLVFGAALGWLHAARRPPAGPPVVEPPGKPPVVEPPTAVPG